MKESILAHIGSCTDEATGGQLTHACMRPMAAATELQ